MDDLEVWFFLGTALKFVSFCLAATMTLAWVVAN